MNAYELHEAAFDSACDWQEESIAYIKQYADGAFHLYVPDSVAQEILNCRKAFAASERGSHNLYYEVERPLMGIEI